MSITVMRGIDCQIMSLSSLANYIAALSPQLTVMSTPASWIGSDIRIPRKRRMTSGASVRLPGVVDPLLERRIALMADDLGTDLDQALPVRRQRPVPDLLGQHRLLLLAKSGPPVARNRLPLFPQQRTFPRPRPTSGFDPKPSFPRTGPPRSRLHTILAFSNCRARVAGRRNDPAPFGAIRHSVVTFSSAGNRPR